MEESKCIIQNNPVYKVEKKSIVKENLVQAGQEHPFIEENKNKKLPREGMYSEETHIYSPISRGF